MPDPPKVPKAPKPPRERSKGAAPGRRGPSRGAKLALVVLAIAVVVLLGVTVAGLVKSPSHNEVSVFDLKPGMCLNPPPKGQIQEELSKLSIISCSTPHTEEVYFVHSAPATVVDRWKDNYPGKSKVQVFAQGYCIAPFRNYVGVAYQDSTLFFTYLMPSVRSWTEAKDRTIACVVTTTGQKLTHSVKNSNL